LAKGFPTNKWEEWKYASLKSLNDVDWNWNTSEAPASVLPVSMASALQLKSLNGKFSVEGVLPTGIEIMDFTSFPRKILPLYKLGRIEIRF